MAFDLVLRRLVKGARLPPLAVGLGIYLPTMTTLIIIVGSISGWAFNRRAARGPRAETMQQLGTLLASGLIVGESILGVVLAAAVALSGNPAPIAIAGERFAAASTWLGGIVFALLVCMLYWWVGRLARGSVQT